MSKFTPGPWSVYRESHDEGMTFYFGIDDANEDAVVLHDIDGGVTSESDAYLIAAAPDLYNAASNALEALIACAVPAGGCDDRAAILEAQMMLRLALRKADGKP